MFLKEFSFKRRNIFDENDLIIEKIIFNNQNLIVGKNGMGKSTVLRYLFSITEILKGANNMLIDGEWELTLGSPINSIKYYIKIEKSSIIEEEITSNEDILFSRQGEKGTIFSIKENKLIEIFPPDYTTITSSRRDKREHPFIEEIVNWAINFHFFNFGSITPSSSINGNVLKSSNSNISNLIRDLKQYEDREKIVENINELGYNVKDFDYNQNTNSLYIQEHGLNFSLPQHELSQGMLRSILLLIFIDFLEKTEQSQTIIIDDMCEGLDYERALKLGKAILKKIKDKNIQLILTSNDSFLMEVIPIKYWNILTREKSVIKTANYQNSKAKFDEFKFTGLSNFDLFSSDYLTENK